MQKYPSKISLTETSTSSRMANACHTHVIIETVGDGKDSLKYILLPVKNLLDFGRPLRTNDLVTYKPDLRNRRTQRGRIHLFGSEDECTEQLQILMAVVDEDNLEISGTCDITNQLKLHTNESMSRNPVTNRDEADCENNHEQRTYGHMLKMTTNKSAKSNSIRDTDEASVNDNEGIHHSSAHNIYSTSTRRRCAFPKSCESEKAIGKNSSSPSAVSKKIGVSRGDSYQTTLDQILKKKMVIGTVPSSRSSITFKDLTDEAVVERHGATTKDGRMKEKVIIQSQLSPPTPQHDESSQSQEYGLDAACHANNDQENMHRGQLNIDPNVTDRDYVIKEFRRLQHENAELKTKYNKLVCDYQDLKTCSLPMPNESARQWMIESAKLMGPKSSGLSIETITTELSLESPSLLMSCVRETPSNTTRQLVKLLYSPNKLKNGRGADVSHAQRKLIKEFVEKVHGSIDKRSFKEAINGVFRSHIHAEKKKLGTPTRKKSIVMNNNTNTAAITVNSHEKAYEHFVYDESEEDDDF